jgi:itaconyl-CoA hydratase
MQGHDQIGPQRYRESFGRYYDDFTVGDVYEHRPGRTITESDNTWFTLITMNTHPLHFDKEYAAKSEFKAAFRQGICGQIGVQAAPGQ